MTASDWPPYRGFAPVATCHWQAIANIFVLYGMPDPLTMMSPSWGVRWQGDRTLYGAGSWRRMLSALLDAEVREYAPPTPEQAAQVEASASDAGLPYVAEVDAWFLRSPYERSEHIVHTIVVTAQTDELVTVVDPMNNPVPVQLPVPLYQQMRSHPCAGRLEPHKLYVPAPGPYRKPPLAQVARVMRAEIVAAAESSLRDLAGFADWAATSDELPDVCRVAGERHQAALLFDVLAGGSTELGERHAAAMGTLRDDWYLVHMLCTHPRARDPRQRRRISRRLRDLLTSETAFAELAGAS